MSYQFDDPVHHDNEVTEHNVHNYSEASTLIGVYFIRVF